MTKKTFLALAACTLPAAAFAQSSVTMFGLMDAGISYVSNQGGHGAAKFDDNIFFPNLLGFEGKEDLGAGTRAIFRLVNQYSLGNGSIIGGGLFARTAYVGLQNDRYGTLTLGNQYEFMVDALAASGNEIAQDLVGLYGFRNGPFDRLALPNNPTGAFDWDRVAGSNRVANSVKYTSPSLSGLTVGALYGFGNVPGSVKTSSKYDFAVGYEKGPFAAVVTFDRQNGAADSVTPADTVNYIQGIHAGLSYDFGNLKTMAGYRNYKRTFRTSAANQLSDTYWLGGSYQFTPAFSLIAAVYHQNIKGGSDADPTLVSLRANYALSKRTVLYAAGAFAIAKHDQKVGVSRDFVGYGTTQVGVTAGIQQRF